MEVFDVQPPFKPLLFIKRPDGENRVTGVCPVQIVRIIETGQVIQPDKLFGLSI